MIGLALMAAKLAGRRCGYSWCVSMSLSSRPTYSPPYCVLRPIQRYMCDPITEGANEYYRIIDNITAGRKP